MSTRMEILETAYEKIQEYTRTLPWRPGLVDLFVYNNLINMHESDYENESTVPDFIWKKTPDEVMEDIIQSNRIFDLEYGWDDLDEQIRNYLIENEIIVDPLDEEEQTNIGGK